MSTNKSALYSRNHLNLDHEVAPDIGLVFPFKSPLSHEDHDVKPRNINFGHAGKSRLSIPKIEDISFEEARALYLQFESILRSTVQTLKIQDRLKLLQTGAELLRLHPGLAHAEALTTTSLIDYGLDHTASAWAERGFPPSILVSAIADYLSEAVKDNAIMRATKGWNEILPRVLHLSRAGSYTGKKHKDISQESAERLRQELKKAAGNETVVLRKPVARELTKGPTNVVQIGVKAEDLPLRSRPTTFMVPTGTFHINSAAERQEVSGVRLTAPSQHKFEEVLQRIYRCTEGMQTGAAFVTPYSIQSDAEFIERTLLTITPRWFSEDSGLSRRTVTNLIHSVMKLDAATDLFVTRITLLNAAVLALALSPDLLRTWDFPRAAFKTFASMSDDGDLLANFAMEALPKLDALREKAHYEGFRGGAGLSYAYETLRSLKLPNIEPFSGDQLDIAKHGSSEPSSGLGPGSSPLQQTKVPLITNADREVQKEGRYVIPEFENITFEKARELYIHIETVLRSTSQKLTMQDRLKLFEIGAALLKAHSGLAQAEALTTISLMNYGLQHTKPVWATRGFSLAILGIIIADYLSEAAVDNEAMRAAGPWDKILAGVQHLSRAANYAGEKHKDIPPAVSERLQQELEKAGVREKGTVRAKVTTKQVSTNAVKKELTHHAKPFAGHDGAGTKVSASLSAFMRQSNADADLIRNKRSTLPPSPAPYFPTRTPLVTLPPSSTTARREAIKPVAVNVNAKAVQSAPTSRRHFESVLSRLNKSAEDWRGKKSHVRIEDMLKDARFVESTLFTVGRDYFAEDSSLSRKTVSNLLQTSTKLTGLKDVYGVRLTALRATFQALVLAPSVLKGWDYPYVTFASIAAGFEKSDPIAIFAKDCLSRLAEMHEHGTLGLDRGSIGSPQARRNGAGGYQPK